MTGPKWYTTFLRDGCYLRQLTIKHAGAYIKIHLVGKRWYTKVYKIEAYNEINRLLLYCFDHYETRRGKEIPADVCDRRYQISKRERERLAKGRLYVNGEWLEDVIPTKKEA